MNVGVLLHIALLMESLSTVFAWIWSRIGVDQQMRGECAAPLECLAALTTCELLLVVVHRHVLLQRDLMAEALLAYRAVEWTTAGVGSTDVNLGNRRICQRIPTGHFLLNIGNNDTQAC